MVLSANRLVVLQLLKHHRAAAGRGGAFLRLGRSQRALTDLAAGQKAHEPRAALVPHRHHLWHSVQIANRQLPAIPGDGRKQQNPLCNARFITPLL